MKKLLSAIFICFIVSGCFPENSIEKPDAAIVKIADRTFEIPRVYIDLGANRDVIENSVVLVYVLPGFEPEPPHPKERSKRRELIRQGRMRGMLLEEAAVRPSLDIMVYNTLRPNSLPEKQIFNSDIYTKIYGLEKYISSNPNSNSTTQVDDLFVERNTDGSVFSYLRCTPPSRKELIPSCRHTFVNKGLLYRIRWHITELPNWKKQRDVATEFIDHFEIEKAPKTEKE